MGERFVIISHIHLNGAYASKLNLWCFIMMSLMTTDRLLNNPWVQPPLPSDWEVRPTYPIRHVPYYLAPLWDACSSRNTISKIEEQRKQKSARTNESQAKIPRELKERLKKSKAAKGLLQDLEKQVRKFVKDWEEKTKIQENESLPSDLDSGDEEIVFIGRNGQMRDVPASPISTMSMDDEKLGSDQLIFQSPANDQQASFGSVSLSLPHERLLKLLQALACTFHWVLLRSSHLVHYCW